MAYSDVALLSADNDFIMRTRAAAAQEGEADPVQWSNAYIWQMAGSPGFGDKYASALAAEVPRPGNDQSVISDPEILSAIQALRTPTGTQSAKKS